MLLINVAIVENEEDVARKDAQLLDRYALENDLTIEKKTFSNALDFLEDKTNFDVVLMDIDMPGINGMDAAEQLRKQNKNIDIVFTTNLPQYAIDGYKVEAIDFVIKPVTFPNLSFAMDKVAEKKKNSLNGSFFLKIGTMARRFDNDEIIYFEMLGHNIIMHEEGLEPFKVRGSLKMIEPVLNPDVFVKINSGIIVNISKVRSLDDGMCIMEDDTSLPVSRSHKKEFSIRIAKFYGNHFEG